MLKRILFIWGLAIIQLGIFAQQRIPMHLENSGIYTIPCEVNGLKLRFVFDTGASDVHLSLLDAAFMLKNGYISKDDFIGKTSYSMADGSISENAVVNIKEIKIGNLCINDVRASVSSKLNASLLLGQSAIQKIGKYTIDDDYLILHKSPDLSEWDKYIVKEDDGDCSGEHKDEASLTTPTKQEAIEVLRECVALTNEQLPMKVSFFTMQKFEIHNNDYIVYMKIDENQQDLDKYVDNMNKSKSNMFSLVAGQRQEFAKVFIESGLNLKFTLIGNLSKRTKYIFLSSEEIKKSFGSKYSSKDYLKDLVAEMSKTTPEDWGDGLTFTGIKIEGDYVCYRIKTDETVLTIPLLKMAKAEGHEMEDNIIEEFNSTNDAADLFFIKYLKQSNMGIKYTYWSEKTPESVVFVIYPYTIKTKVKNKSVY